MKCYTKGKKPCNEIVKINLTEVFKKRDELRNKQTASELKGIIKEKMAEKGINNCCVMCGEPLPDEYEKMYCKKCERKYK